VFCHVVRKGTLIKTIKNFQLRYPIFDPDLNLYLPNKSLERHPSPVRRPAWLRLCYIGAKADSLVLIMRDAPNNRVMRLAAQVDDSD
jgi:hypothetical protein